MNVLIVTGIFPPDVGGPASYVPRIATALQSSGCHVEVATLADPAALSATGEFPFVVHRINRSLPRPVRMVRTVRRIAALARRADVVLANGLHLEAAIAARLVGRPAIAKVVGDTIWERARHAGRQETLDAFQVAPLPLRWRAMRRLQNLYIGAYDRVLTPSDYLKRMVVGWGVPSQRIDVVYNAVPAPPLASPASPTFDIVSVGRLVPWKGFDDLIAIAGRRGWSLRIVGDGPLRASLEQQATVGATVEFSGHVAQADVANAIRSGRVFALNSSYEGLPHIVLEAMAVGVPVIASAAGGTPETIVHGRTGLLVKVGDPAGLEAALAQVLADEDLRAELAGHATQALVERFSFAAMVRETRQVLEALASQGRRR